MRLRFNYNNSFFEADLPPSMTLADLSAYIQAETNLPPTHQTLMHKFNQLSPSNITTLEESNIVENDLIVVMPFDPIAQNLNRAYEENPEFFVDVTMLYIKISINGIELPAFIDTGAQRSLISPALCELCDLNHLIDKRFKMQAKGVGEQQSDGRIHSIPMIINNTPFSTSLTVLNIKEVGLLIGLDWMKRFRIKLDLEKNGIFIDDLFVEFLNEYEVKTLKKKCGIVGELNEIGIIKNDKDVKSNNSVSSVNKTSTQNNNNKTHSLEQQNKIKTLINLGFDEKSSIFALEQSGWNVDLAAGMLF